VAYRADDRLDTTFRDGDDIPVLPRLVFRGSSRASGAVEVMGSASFDELRPGGDALLTVIGGLAAGRLILEPGAILHIAGVVRVDSAVVKPNSRVVLGPAGRLAGSAASILRLAATGEGR
jgi:hypothetical protein